MSKNSLVVETNNHHNFTKSIIDKITETYTYSYAKNAWQYDIPERKFDPVTCFNLLLEVEDPFKVFMKLDRYGYKNTKKALDKYGITYTPEQDHRARIFYDVTQAMEKECSDVVAMYIEDWTDTGVMRVGNGFNFTTIDTKRLADIIENRSPYAQSWETLYSSKIDPRILSNEEQMEAIKTCLNYRTSCLIGGAGTGKSFVTAELIRQLKYNDKLIAVLTPTHKAREALQSKLDGEVTVRTIHSFAHGNDHLNYGAIIVDEAGMLSTPLLLKLLSKTNLDTKLIFVGDKNQLAPIEYGRPFEILQKRFQTTELKDNHRSESPDIVNLGRMILGINQNDNTELSNIEVVPTVEDAFKQGAEVLLTFTNERVRETNEKQRIKNGEPSIAEGFSIGDKVVAKTNKRGKFYNGQLFTITAYDKLTGDNGKEIDLKTWQDLAYNFQLAYGLTIHKSQGSEWDTVAYLPSELDTRNLAYVAVTRAKKKLIIVGSLNDKYATEKEWKHYINYSF